MTDSNVDESLLARDAREPRAGNKTDELVSSAQQKVEAFKHRVADRLATTADCIEQFETPEFPRLDAVALREQAADVIRRFPLQSLAVGLGVGLLFGRALKR